MTALMRLPSSHWLGLLIGTLFRALYGLTALLAVPTISELGTHTMRVIRPSSCHYRVRLCIEGIPMHGHTEGVTAKLVEPKCSINFIETEADARRSLAGRLQCR